MTYHEEPKAHPSVKERSKRDIEAVNAYLDKLRGTVITLEYLRYGQSAPYSDSITDVRLFAHQPNSLTTNAPSVRVFKRTDVLALAHVFFGNFKEASGGWDTYLEYLDPEPNPCGLEELSPSINDEVEPRYSCWRIVLRTPYND